MNNFGMFEYDLREARHYGITLKEYMDYKKDMETFYDFK